VNDPIYDLAEPNGQFVASTGFCYLCDKNEENRCDFCGNNCCKTCCPKLFPFVGVTPGGQSDEEGEDCGMICKVCETKMYVRNFYTEIDGETKSLTNDLLAKVKEISKLKKKQMKLIVTEQG
jgi:hypothetical protein